MLVRGFCETINLLHIDYQRQAENVRVWEGRCIYVPKGLQLEMKTMPHSTSDSSRRDYVEVPAQELCKIAILSMMTANTHGGDRAFQYSFLV